ncbi:MAG: DegT/DnrJ/EryC1/StrS family aminotransferase [Caldilineaceae bacterium]|nr:DegT/DnrJ/EryC1/StrS family aminotransferase [Caldilineaceae bacterium]
MAERLKELLEVGDGHLEEGRAEEAQNGLPTMFPRIVGPNCLKYVEEVISGGLKVNMTERFEKAFAERLGVKHCITTPGCTSALATLASALRFEPGDEVIVSPITDFGTVQGLCVEGYIPVFADTEAGTVNVCAETIEECITDRTRAILVVHKTGLVCDMDPINELARKHNLFVYEDACQAAFSEYKGRLVGTLADAAAFSFDPEKTMGSDIGGCVVTDSDELASRMRFLAHDRGAEWIPGYGRYHHEMGYSYRMPECTAAICLGQLEVIGEQAAHRDRIARILWPLLEEIPGITPLPIPDNVTLFSCWMVGFHMDPRQFHCTAEAFSQQLADAGIPGAGTAKYYLMPEALAFLQKRAESKSHQFAMPPASRSYHYNADNCPNAKAYLENFIRWASIGEKYRPEHCELIAEIVRRVADRNRSSGRVEQKGR